MCTCNRLLNYLQSPIVCAFAAFASHSRHTVQRTQSPLLGRFMFQPADVSNLFYDLLPSMRALLQLPADTLLLYTHRVHPCMCLLTFLPAIVPSPPSDHVLSARLLLLLPAAQLRCLSCLRVPSCWRDERRLSFLPSRAHRSTIKAWSDLVFK